MKCSNCNNEIPKQSKICPICGTIFETYFEDMILTKKEKIKLLIHKIIPKALVIIPIIILISIFIIKYKIKTNIINENVVKENNQFYDSTEKYYKYILNKKEKNIYDIILKGIQNYDEIIEINLENYNIEKETFRTKTLKNIKQVLSMDHPELINLGTINIYEENNKIIKLIINYTMQKEKLDESIATLKNTINELKENTKDLNEYEKIKYIYNYMEQTEYTYELDTKYFSAFSCIILKKCNIYGYAKATQIILTNLNINTTLVTGTLNNKYHEWNIVKIENEYYNYDQANKKILFNDKNYIPNYKNIIPNKYGKKYNK